MCEQLRIRPANLGDARQLFDWRNDEHTRHMSADTSPLQWEQHLEWFEQVLSGQVTGRAIYIVENHRAEPIGTVRSDVRSDGYSEISYTVAPEWRGKGLAKQMVFQFVHDLLKHKKIAARIKKGSNPASEAIAAALGLRPFAETPAVNPGDPPIVEWR